MLWAFFRPEAESAKKMAAHFSPKFDGVKKISLVADKLRREGQKKKKSIIYSRLFRNESLIASENLHKFSSLDSIV